MLNLVDARPEQLRAIAAFLEDPKDFTPLIEAKVRPVIEVGNPDKLIGWEATNAS